MIATEACKLGRHDICDGTGTDEDNDGAEVACECPCHSDDQHDTDNGEDI